MFAAFQFDLALLGNWHLVGLENAIPIDMDDSQSYAL